ncbi:MAG: S46 family peptidase [Holophagaceae bacterium]|nr:S46 family peptidase [Holophagaceae bacterium]
MKKLILPLMATLLTTLPALRADEGMWTFDNLPLKLLKEKYNFTPTQEWLDHVRLSAITMGGCSASFVSADGLMLTNHHCGRGQIGSLSTADNDLLTNGFVARTRAEELKTRMTVRVLQQMQNVTEKVNTAVKPGMSASAAEEAKNKALQEAVEEMGKSTGLNCSPVRLYQGGEFWVYGYMAFDDVRLVAAPELQAASFGGHPDNFTFPRHDLDFAIFRVYKDDKPYTPAHYLKWSIDPLKEGDLTFVIGHPGSTNRGMTYNQMLYARDVTSPISVKASERSRSVLLDYGKISPENRRAVLTQLLGVENSLKNGTGYYTALLDEAAMKKVKAREDELRDHVNKRPDLKKEAGQSWEQIDKALASTRTLAPTALMASAAPSSVLSSLRSTVAQIETGNAPQAPRGGAAGGRGGANQPAPRADLELMQLEAWLKDVQATLPAQNDLVKAALNGLSPAQAAKSIVASPMKEESARKSLIDGGKTALATSNDHAVVLARTIYKITTENQKRQADANAIISDHGSRIARARLAVYGKDTYPDATGTLRLTFGPVEGFEANGTIMQPFTTFGGMYDRYIGWGGNEANAHDGMWALPQRWLDKRPNINPDEKLNFSHSVDIIGGNSGSPVINKKGEVVGLIFDGNITMLPGRYYYDENNNRGVSVDARAIIETLDKVMDAKHLVRELIGK